MAQHSSTADLLNLTGIDPLVKNFIELISFDTRAEPESKAIPSSVGQLRFGAYLCSLIRDLGFDARQDEKGMVKVSIAATKGCENAKRLCLFAHMDTAPDASGENIKPALVKNYEGGDIILANSLVLNQKICPELERFAGQDIIVTDGSTLLGADDKAGISCILLLLQKISTDANFVHGPLTVVFTVDEEIGKSSTYVDVKELDCDYGLTVDGTTEGELDTGTFNAYGACVRFNGVSVHTAVAYKKLVNAITLANEFISMLPRDEKPENTFKDEGFYHVHNIEGSVSSCKLNMIIRDFSREGMDLRLALLEKTVNLMQQKYGKSAVEYKATFQYANMEEVLKTVPEYIELIKKAYQLSDVKVIENRVRGGTDGSNLSVNGLPTPNMFTGALNCHGPYECLPVSSFNNAFKVLLNIVKLMADTKR